MDENNNQQYSPWENNQQYNQQQNNQQEPHYQQPPYQQPYYNQPVQEEKASVGLAILSFIIPIAGLIIYLTKKDSRPKTAKVSGICALVSFLLNIVLSVIITVTSGFLAADTILGEGETYFNEVEVSDNYEEDSTVVEGTTLGEYDCIVTGAKISTDYSDRKIVVVSYDFTNNSTEPQSFDLALTTTAFQDGVELEQTWLDDEDTDLEIEPRHNKGS